MLVYNNTISMEENSTYDNRANKHDKRVLVGFAS